MNQVGIGTRVLNFLVDTLLIFLLSFASYKGWQFYSYYWGIIFIPFYVFFWIILLIYYLLFEFFFKRTPGKWLTFSKVVSVKKNKLFFLQIFLRSLVRLTIIDFLFIPFLNKTLHDYLSGTDVVEV